MEVATVIDFPAKFDVLGLGLSATSNQDSLDLLGQVGSGGSLRMVFANVHTTMTCQRDRNLQVAVAAAELVVPDGVPLVWAMKSLHGKSVERMRGPSFMRTALSYGVEKGWRHYFYGAESATIKALVTEAEKFAPGVQIVGTYSPPFGKFSEDLVRADLDRIRACAPDIVWVGLGMPKQEMWLHTAQRSGSAEGMALLAVGAAFDLLSGRLPEAPKRMQKVGMEWLFRLSLEPRRLWRRYLINNPLFLIQLGIGSMRKRRSWS